MTIREINETIEEGESLKTIALVFVELASVKIRKIRAEVEQNRLFFDEIAQVYRTVRQQAVSKKVSVKKTKPAVSILLTSNYGFYGNIDIEVVRLFLETTPKFPTDRVIIGRTGQAYLKAMRYFNPYEPLVFKNDLPNPNELKALNAAIRNYSQILVFYPELHTLLVQKPAVTDITQTYRQEFNQTSVPAGSYVIFEPELEKILEFFNDQIISLLLEQTFFEAELARTGARIIAMDQAQTEAGRYLETQKQLKAHIQRMIQNTRLLENLNSMMAVRKETHG